MLEEWLKYQDEFIDEYARLESSPLLTCLPECVSCKRPHPTFRCTDCFAELLFCENCLLTSHGRKPFHSIQVCIPISSHILMCIDAFQRWTGTHFIPVSLRDLGAVFHLGHVHGSPCIVPSTPVPLTVFDVTGVHIVNTTYCECDVAGSAVPPRVQLLRNRWFPATWHRPGTAFTFRFLNFLHKLQSTSKINLYDFHNAITSVLDGSGLSKPLVRT